MREWRLIVVSFKVSASLSLFLLRRHISIFVRPRTNLMCRVPAQKLDAKKNPFRLNWFVFMVVFIIIAWDLARACAVARPRCHVVLIVLLSERSFADSTRWNGIVIITHSCCMWMWRIFFFADIFAYMPKYTILIKCIKMKLMRFVLINRKKLVSPQHTQTCGVLKIKLFVSLSVDCVVEHTASKTTTS